MRAPRLPVLLWRCCARMVAATLLSSCAAIQHSEQPLPWSEARQLIVVITADWNADRGTLRTYSRDARGWRTAGDALPVVIGRAGSAWGLGLHPRQPGPAKLEGDGRSPAGVFAIGSAFGYAPSEPTSLPYAALSDDDYCVDVSGSPLYNRIVDAREVGSAAVAGSTEHMRRDLQADGDDAYKIGFVIEHNPHGRAGAGSCIFAHLWKSADSSTSGCTAMAEPAMRAVLRWLQTDEHPVFVLLPRDEYARLRTAWQLPDIATP